MLISLTAQFVDPRLERFARGGRGMHVVDDRHGFRSAGCESWVKSGFLDPDEVLLKVLDAVPEKTDTRAAVA